MYPKHTQVFIRTAFVIMHHRNTRIKNRPEFLVYSTSYIDIFRIQKKTFVKQANFLKRFGTKKHETPRKIGNIHHFIVAGSSHFEFFGSFSRPTFRQESTKNQVERCRKQFTKILNVAIRTKNFRHQQSHLLMGVHKVNQFGQNFRSERHIRIQYKMIRNVPSERFTNRNVVSCTVAKIFPCENISDGKFFKIRIGQRRIVDKEDIGNKFRLFEFFY